MAFGLALHLGVLLHLFVPPTAAPPARTSDALASAGTAGKSGSDLQLVYVDPVVRAEASEASPEAAVMPSSPMSPPQPALSISTQRQERPRVRPLPAERRPEAQTPQISAVANSTAPESAEARDVEAQPASSDSPVSSARFFRADGSIALPASVLEDLQAVESEDRMFSHMTPGLAGAESAFRRPSALPYTPTRFDADWKPVRSVGEDALVTLSEALTYENRSGTLRCSLVPPVCSWGRIRTAVELNDPNTLNPIEDAQCEALWISIVAATDQGEWLRLRRRFDAECRKPLEIDRAVPAPRVEAPGSR
jgi:hypothetical protein